MAIDLFQWSRGAFAVFGLGTAVWRGGRWVLRKTLAERYIIPCDFGVRLVRGVQPLRVVVEFSIINQAWVSVRPKTVAIVLLAHGQPVGQANMRVIHGDQEPFTARIAPSDRGRVGRKERAGIGIDIVPTSDFWRMALPDTFGLAESFLTVGTMFGDLRLPLSRTGIRFLRRDDDQSHVRQYVAALNGKPNATS